MGRGSCGSVSMGRAALWGELLYGALCARIYRVGFPLYRPLASRRLKLSSIGSAVH